jgi:hypothetical protein
MAPKCHPTPLSGDGRSVVVNPVPGKGDVVADAAGMIISAECKGGIINTRHSGQVSRLYKGLCETVGLLMANPSPGPQIAVVPRTEGTHRLAKRLAPRCAAAGIEIALVGSTDNGREPRRAMRGSTAQRSMADTQWRLDGWTPLLSARVGRDGEWRSIRGDGEANFLDLVLAVGTQIDAESPVLLRTAFPDLHEVTFLISDPLATRAQIAVVFDRGSRRSATLCWRSPRKTMPTRNTRWDASLCGSSAIRRAHGPSSRPLRLKPTSKLRSTCWCSHCSTSDGLEPRADANADDGTYERRPVGIIEVFRPS